MLLTVLGLSEDRERASFIKKRILCDLSDQRKKILGEIIGLLHDVAALSEENKMPARNLAAVWVPNLIRNEDPQEDMRILTLANKFLEILITLAPEIFE